MEAVSTGALAARLNVDACGHVDLAYLGGGRNTSYQRCRTCGAIVIGQLGQTWILRPRPH